MSERCHSTICWPSVVVVAALLSSSPSRKWPEATFEIKRPIYFHGTFWPGFEQRALQALQQTLWKNASRQSSCFFISSAIRRTAPTSRRRDGELSRRARRRAGANTKSNRENKVQSGVAERPGVSDPQGWGGWFCVKDGWLGSDWQDGKKRGEDGVWSRWSSGCLTHFGHWIILIFILRKFLRSSIF